MPSKTKIIYVFDSMCGWCFGFSGIIQKVAARYAGEFDFEIISGGMVIGEREGPIGDFADYILGAYKRVEEYSGVRFGEPYLAQLKTKQLYSSSVMPSVAIEAFKDILPAKAIAFASSVQNAYFVEGKDLRNEEVYAGLIKPFDVDPTLFLAKLKDDETRIRTYNNFKQAASLGVTGYPAVIALMNDKYFTLTKGFTDYNTLNKNIEIIKTI